MSDDYSFLLIRVVRGEESLGTAFWVTLILMAAYFAYEYYIPSVTDIFEPYFHFFDVFILTYSAVAMWLCCRNSGAAARFFARLYVLALLAAGAYVTWRHFGIFWAYGYPVMAVLLGFVVKE